MATSAAIRGDDLYQHQLVIEEIRQAGSCGNPQLLVLSLLMAALVHLTLIYYAPPIEKRDAHLQHPASLLEVELVMLAMAYEPRKSLLRTPPPSKPEAEKLPPAPLIQPQPEPAIKTIKKVVPAKTVHRAAPIARTKPRPRRARRAAPPADTAITTRPTAHPAAAIAPEPSAPTQSQATAARVAPPPSLRQQRQAHYLAQVIRRIRAHKQYPYSARRRRFEGGCDCLVQCQCIRLPGTDSHRGSIRRTVQINAGSH